MSYYTALIAAWNGATQPPTGTTGTGLTGTMTTVQKLAAANGWQVTGSIPTNFYVTGAQLANCINWNEFKALSAAAQSNLLALCNIPGPLLGGTANVASLTDGMMLGYFTGATGPTILALTALASSQIQPWWQVPVANGGGGLNTSITQNDLTAAGGLS